MPTSSKQHRTKLSRMMKAQLIARVPVIFDALWAFPRTYRADTENKRIWTQDTPTTKSAFAAA